MIWKWWLSWSWSSLITLTWAWSTLLISWSKKKSRLLKGGGMYVIIICSSRKWTLVLILEGRQIQKAYRWKGLFNLLIIMIIVLTHIWGVMVSRPCLSPRERLAFRNMVRLKLMGHWAFSTIKHHQKLGILKYWKAANSYSKISSSKP